MSKIPSVPRDMPVHHQQFFTAMKEILDRISPPNIAPGRPSNVTVKPLPGGHEITFTAGDSSDGHLLLVSDQPTWNPARANNHVIDLQLSTKHVDMVGTPGVARYYWLVAKRGNVRSDPPTGPVSGTTLPLATPAAASKFVPLGKQVVKSAQTGHATILTSKRSGHRNVV
jgi:hypothetical protein